MNQNLSIEIKKKIIDFLGGREFLFYKKELSFISQAIDLFYSDYAANSFWGWNDWRIRNGYNTLSKPILPNRFKKNKNNIYIKSLDPPLISNNIIILNSLHKKLRKEIFK